MPIEWNSIRLGVPSLCYIFTPLCLFIQNTSGCKSVYTRDVLSYSLLIVVNCEVIESRVRYQFLNITWFKGQAYRQYDSIFEPQVW